MIPRNQSAVYVVQSEGGRPMPAASGAPIVLRSMP